MSEIEESVGNVYQDLGLENANDMLTKSSYVAKMALLIETSDVSEPEVAEKLELSLEKLQEILRGQFRDEPVHAMADYLEKISEITGSPP
ncbi:transcriptional regulator [Pseudomonas sp. MPR-ANC1]|uniref:XRE family transcriptional regulator n=1 Tax=Pseudomonas sp. MPR-ANC1 TaxID=2075548 RepID=UPI000CD10CF9|nr:XRE family transcriptional regulator [Pseudomonas sp. MPR-ANC1]POA48174.1 transcriptional regulator [Pseudomonas sp. MPR-ANC1]